MEQGQRDVEEGEGQVSWDQAAAGIPPSQDQWGDKLPHKVELDQHHVQQNDVDEVHGDGGLGARGEEGQAGWGGENLTYSQGCPEAFPLAKDPFFVKDVLYNLLQQGRQNGVHGAHGEEGEGWVS